MLPKLFDVRDLRVAVNDQAAAVRGDREPPTNSQGQRLAYGWVEAVPCASYAVDAGETLALIGESASGKSLMLLGAFGLLPGGTRALGGTTTYRNVTFEPGGRRDEQQRPLSRRERRRLRRAGTVLDDADPEWARALATGIGFLFQNPIASWTPILEIGPQAGEVLSEYTDLTSDEITERVMDALGEVHLPRSRRLFEAFSSQLSRGMGQRAMLAAALVKAPKLLIADEPLSGLDVSVAAAILDLIKDLKERWRRVSTPEASLHVGSDRVTSIAHRRTTPSDTRRTATARCGSRRTVLVRRPVRPCRRCVSHIRATPPSDRIR